MGNFGAWVGSYGERWFAVGWLRCGGIVGKLLQVQGINRRTLVELRVESEVNWVVRLKLYEPRV